VLNEQHITLSHFSLRYATLRERVTAASEAGFAGIGLYSGRYEKWLNEGWSGADISTLIADHGLEVTELEAVQNWAGTPEQRALAGEQERALYAMAEAVGGTTISVVGAALGEPDELAELFAAICDRAHERGLRVGVEFAAITDVPDVAAAMRIVDGAGRPNGGLCLDSWHFFRGRPVWEDLDALNGDRVVTVQLNDGPLAAEEPDYFSDNMVNRRPPGEGEFDLLRFVRTLDRIGSRAPLAVEVISAELQGLPPTEAAARLARGTRSLLATARGTG
jgi:sugar phosphate isomerase/epimerase